jgi:type IV pilus assembly protein PilQ
MEVTMLHESKKQRELKKRSLKTKLTRMATVWLLAVVAMAAIVIGQDVPEDQQVQVMTPFENVDQDQAVTEAVQESVGTLSIQPIIKFNTDMAIADALRFLSLKYQKNIVPSANIMGNITVTTLYNVTFEEALQMVIGPTNKYEIMGNFIMVYTAEEYEQLKADKRRMEYKAISLYYLTADEAQKLVAALLSPDGQMATSSPAATGVPTGTSISSDSAGGDNLAFQDTIVINDYPENIQRVEEMLAGLDKRPQQVLIEATILAATLTENMDMGIDWNLAAGTAINMGNVVAGGIPGIAAEMTGFAPTGSGLTIGVSSGNAAAIISAIEAITDTTIIANPKILAVNKQLGQVYIGTKIGYRENDVITEGGAVQQGAVKFLDTGTKLSFRPYIGNDGFIRMDIHPKDSSGSVDGDGVPSEISAEIATNIIVRDGETVVIGGMFRDEVTSSSEQVPLLGNIPFLGAAFRGKTDNVTRQEVIVLLTPHIIDVPDELEGEKRAEDIARKRLAARDGISWFSTTRLAEDSYSKAVSLYTNGDPAAALKELCWTLNLRPTYVEALRLRERIVEEITPDGGQAIERIMLQAIENEDAAQWIRL